MRGMQAVLLAVIVLVVWSPRATEQKGDLIDFTCLLYTRDVKRTFALKAGYEGLQGKYKEQAGNGPCSYDLSRHHIIPNSDLLRFFRKALIEANNDNIHNDLIRFYTKLANAAIARISPDLPSQRIRDNVAGLSWRSRLPEEPWPIQALFGNDETDGMYALRSFSEWMPFNFFKGPSGKNRVDDPENGFEETCDRIAGTENLDNLRNAYRNITTFLASGNYEEFAHVIIIFETMLDRVPNGYRGYTPSDWLLVGQVRNQCKFRLKTVGERRRRRREAVEAADDFSDPFCLDTQVNILKKIKSDAFWYDSGHDQLVDLEQLNLVSTKKVLDAVASEGLEEDAYWSFRTWIVIFDFFFPFQMFLCN